MIGWIILALVVAPVTFLILRDLFRWWTQPTVRPGPYPGWDEDEDQ